MDLAPLRPWEWMQMDQEWWTELTTAKRIWADEHEADAAERKAHKG